MADGNVVVLDVGSSETKAGWANPEREPPVLTPTAVRIRDGDGPSVSGEVHRPVQRRVIRNWDEVEAIWNYVLYDQLAWVAGEEGAVLVAEPLFNSREAREQTTQILFETFNVSGLYMAEQPLLSLYATGKLTGTVVDVGDSCVDISPISDGQLVTAGLRRFNLGGGDVNDVLRKLLAARPGGGPPLDAAAAERLKEACCQVAETRDAYDAAMAGGPGAEEQTHLLPDGASITVGRERLQASELFFDPSIAGLDGPGLADEVAGAVAACPLDTRKPLLDSLVVCGGGSLMPGLEARLLSGVGALAAPSQRPGAVRPPEYMPEATLRYAAWLGGAILAKVVFPQNQQINKSDYDETGPYIVHKKCC